MRRRIWDWIVGVVMIALALIVGAFIAGLIGFPISLGVDYLLRLLGKTSNWSFFGSWIFTFILLEAAGFYDYYYRRRINSVTGEAGIFHLIPRAIERIKTGHEALGFVDAVSGQPTALEAPINAAARGWSGLVLFIASVATVIYCAPRNGGLTLVLTGVGLLAAAIGLTFIIQALLAYAGFINRKRKE